MDALEIAPVKPDVYYNDMDPFVCEWVNRLMLAGRIADGHVDCRSICDVNADDIIRYRRAHFFSGIAGWELALQLAGWPEHQQVWSGSAPCQPFSSAGKQKGFDDERDLWPEFFGLIRACQPEIVFGEQVASSEVVGSEQETAFLVAVQAGDFARANKLAKQLVAKPSFDFTQRWVDRVFTDMEAEGYTGGFAVLGAHSVGAPHIRQRLYWGFKRNGGIRNAERHGLRISGRTNADQPVEPGDGTLFDAWSDFTIGQFRDGKHRRVESVFFKMADGLSNGLGRVQSELVRIFENEVMNYVESRKINAGKAMRDLRDCIASEAFQWTNGGLLSLHSPSVLFSFLCQLTEQGWRFQHEMACPVEGIRGRLVRGVWVAGESASSSCGRELAEQHAIESADALRGLSSLLARTTSSAWSAAYDENAKRVSPLTNSLPRSGSGSVGRFAGGNRKGRLKGYGNAIVPQVAAVFIRAFMEEMGL